MHAPKTDQARWFAEEVHPHESSLRAYLRGAFPSVRDVDDVVQESFLRIWGARAARPARAAARIRFASASVVVALFGALAWQSPAISSWRTPDRGRTIVSEPSRQTLPGGSVVELRDGADISVDFSGPM